MKGFSHESGSLSVPFEWYTPPEIFDALQIEFDLDPCSPPPHLDLNIVPTQTKLTIEDDGLNADWQGNVWLNPPYGNQTKLWLARLSEHQHGIACVFSRTDTKWFKQTIESATGVLFLHKRIRFINGISGMRGTQPGAGSCLIVFGENNWHKTKQSQLGIPMIVDK